VKIGPAKPAAIDQVFAGPVRKSLAAVLREPNSPVIEIDGK